MKLTSDDTKSVKELTDFEQAIQRLNDLSDRIHTMSNLIEDKNDKLFGCAPEGSCEKSKESDAAVSAGAVGVLKDTIETIHISCSELDYQINRQSTLI